MIESWENKGDEITEWVFLTLWLLLRKINHLNTLTVSQPWLQHTISHTLLIPPTRQLGIVCPSTLPRQADVRWNSSQSRIAQSQPKPLDFCMISASIPGNFKTVCKVVFLSS